MTRDEFLGKWDSKARPTSHARAAAAVGLSITIDRTHSTLIFRRLLHVSSITEDYVRISGLVICEVCDRSASDHPPVAGAPYLTAMCDGRAVKL